jgi:hypothetical protein
MSTIPGFSQKQFEGFCRFINKALAEELDKFPTIKDPDHKISFQLFVKGYQLLEPRYSTIDWFLLLQPASLASGGVGNPIYVWRV